MLVLGAFLVVIGLTASGQALLVTSDTSTTLLNATVGADVATARSFVTLNLRRADLVEGGLTPERRATLDAALRLLTDKGQILHEAILAPDGSLLAADDPASATSGPPPDAFRAAVTTKAVQAEIMSTDRSAALAPIAVPSVIREYLPVLAGGEVYAIVAVWRDAGPVLAVLDENRIHVVTITLSAAGVCAILLFFIFRAAQGRLTRQTKELIELTRRDALTGALNHGALVATLADRVERARTGGGAIAVAVLDIDNFRLLNDTYGHGAGDEALLSVSRLLREQLPAGTTWGRYGPDEFLVISGFLSISGTPGAVELEPTIERIRAALADLSLRFEVSERLPVTISAGISFYPTNGEAVTTLLSSASVALDEARTSGGDAIRVAESQPEKSTGRGTFDILQGLIIAVDTKDRYTKRHSEDVARYATFLAERIGLDPEVVGSVRVAGLLHDIGKIGIPDHILRKPGALTSDEYDIVKQHVALGDMIVRDVPDIDTVRAGIRHHHERWDGNGYLTRLEGEAIPLIARILAVGDAFSAMTTTRPYRKGLGVQEALKRLEDAAGSQLEERLVRAFVEGIETAANPPLPESEGGRSLWTPRRRVA
jgi:diguanylate cyclase (GGDEF)-like protein/putative nucleotidyltransferase with HDIG domain